MPARVFGEIPDVPVGTVFDSRQELHEAGVHRPLQAGISGSETEGADSIVISGGYEDDEDFGERIIYTGHGGNDPATGKQTADQELTAGNAALVVSQQRGYPVRVIRGAGGDPLYSPVFGYRYDGLYDVLRHWDEIGVSGHRVIRFELQRRNGQKRGLWHSSRGAHSSGSPNRETPGPKDDSEGLSTLDRHLEDVSASLDLVIETTDTVTEDVKREAQIAVGDGEYETAKALLEIAERLLEFRGDIAKGSRSWSRLRDDLEKPKQIAVDSTPARKKQPQRRKKRADYGKVDPKDKTSQRQFLIPILRILEDNGGKVPAAQVLEEVENRMRAAFKAADLEPLASNPSEPRWRNTAQWARQQLVNEGVMEPSRQKGVWEISDQGRVHLEKHDKSEL